MILITRTPNKGGHKFSEGPDVAWKGLGSDPKRLAPWQVPRDDLPGVATDQGFPNHTTHLGWVAVRELNLSYHNMDMW